MRYLIFLLFIPGFNSLLAQEEGIRFRNTYLPDHTYTQTIEQNSKSVSGYKKGKEKPTVTSKQDHTVAVIRTGKKSGEGQFPLTLEYTEVTSTGGKRNLPEGTIIYGRTDGQNIPEFDSIHAPGFSETEKSFMLKNMQRLLEQVVFPDKNLKVKDKFTKEVPLSIPIGSETLDMIIRTTYILKNIRDGIAYFDILQTYTIKTSGGKFDVKAKGKGKGNLQFDIANGCVIFFGTDTGMKLETDVGGKTLVMENGMHITIRTEVKSNQ